MPGAGLIILSLSVIALWSVAAHRLLDNPRGDVLTGIAWRLLLAYIRVVHRLRVEGTEHIPARAGVGPLVIVANHTAGVDPLLVQGACPFFIRWMMALDMQLPTLEPVWTWAEVISVDRDGREIAATREAVRYLRSGGVLGIFPEGTLERPPSTIMPFLPGVGLIVHRSGARVLPVVIEGTPQIDPAWSSLWRSSRSVVRFMPVIDYTGSGLRAHNIAEDLRARYASWTGWPLNDASAPMAPGGKGK